MDDLECHLCGSCNLVVTDAGFPVCRDCGTALTTHTQEEIDGEDMVGLLANVSSRAQVRTRKAPKSADVVVEWCITTQEFMEVFQHILQSQMRAIITARKISQRDKAMPALKGIWLSYLKSLSEQQVHLDAVSLLARRAVNVFNPSSTPEVSHPHWFWSLDLTLLWLACIQVGEAVVPKDIIMWIKEGVIPFHSSFECLADAMQKDTVARDAVPNIYRTKSCNRRSKKFLQEKAHWSATRFKPFFMPSTVDMVRTAAILRQRYGIDIQCETTVGHLVRRVVVELDLGESVRDMALRVMTVVIAKEFGRDTSVMELVACKFVPTVFAAACVVIALKLCYQRFNLPHEETLDPWTKTLLGRFALPIIRKNLLKESSIGEEWSPEERRWWHMSGRDHATFLDAERYDYACDKKSFLKSDGRTDTLSLDIWRVVRAEGKLSSLIWWLHDITRGLRVPWGVRAPSVMKPQWLGESVEFVESAPTSKYTEFVVARFNPFEDLPNPYIAALLGASEIMGESPWSVHNHICHVEPFVLALEAPVADNCRKSKRKRP